jgi:hypothetical protein
MSYKEIETTIAPSLAIDPIDKADYDVVQALIMCHGARVCDWESLPEDRQEELFNSLKANLAEFVLNVIAG